MGKNIIVACDFSSKNQLVDFLDQIEAVDEDIYCKVGMELFDSGAFKGFSPVELIKERGHKIFLDLKLHDIPNTVSSTIKTLAKYGVEMINIHASGGYQMMKDAVDAVDTVYDAYKEELEILKDAKIAKMEDVCKLKDKIVDQNVDELNDEELKAYNDVEKEIFYEEEKLNEISNQIKELQTKIDNKPVILAVTVLTSISDDVLKDELGVNRTSLQQAVELAKLAQKAGCGGVVCSPKEALAIKEACGDDFLTVTPGIRFREEAKADQKRVATPAFANIIGSDYIVVGRSITGAQDKVAAYTRAKKDFTEEVTDKVELREAEAFIKELKAAIQAPTIILPADSTAQKLIEAGAFKVNTENPYLLKSGIASPLYCNCRDLYKYPEQQKAIMDYLAELVKEYYPEVEAVFGTVMSAVPFGALVGERLGLPIGFVREQAKDHGMDTVIEGNSDKGVKAVQIEDLITSGTSSLQPVNALIANGTEVLGVAGIVDNDFIPSTKLTENGIVYHTITTMSEIAHYAGKSGIITPEDYDKVNAYMNNPKDESWMSEVAAQRIAKKRELKNK